MLFRGAKVLIMDEPTAVLTPQEVESLFATLRDMTKRGHTIVLSLINLMRSLPLLTA